MKWYTYICVSIVCVAGLVPSDVFSATIYPVSVSGAGVGGEGIVRIMIDTEGERLNAISGTVTISESVDVPSVFIGQSALVLWVDQPRPGNTISFSGITPGGFSGVRELFSVVVSPQAYDRVSVSLNQVEARKNDADGSVVPVRTQMFSFWPSVGGTTTLSVEDTVPPESFSLVIGQDPSIFDGDRFVSFATSDKGTGVVRYEWASTLILDPRADAWTPAQSPIRLRGSDLFMRIHVRAVDGLGNTTASSIVYPYYYITIVFGGILIVLVLCALFFVQRYLSRRSS